MRLISPTDVTGNHQPMEGMIANGFVWILTAVHLAHGIVPQRWVEGTESGSTIISPNFDSQLH